MRTTSTRVGCGSARTRCRREDGVALPIVLGLMLMLTAFMLSSLALVLNNMAPSRSDQDSRAALAAAQAGIDEYISRLSANSEYWDRGNVDAANPAFGATGTPVPGTGTGTNGPRFRYRVLTSSATTAQEGFITLEVTGTSRPPEGGRTISRTLTTRLEPSGFLDYVYYTDYEVVDPSLQGMNAATRAACTRYHYNGRSDDTCGRIVFPAGDVVDGPLHSNDALYVDGSVRFSSPRTESSWVKTSNPGQLWRGPGTPSVGTPAAPGYWPRYQAIIDLPDANTQLLRYVQPRTDDSPTPDNPLDRPGCLYEGATRIEFVDDQMKVWSPNTRNAPDRCLTTGSRATEQTKAIPAVIYVAGTSGSCQGVGFPAANEDTSDRITTNYGACRGTAFVKGIVDGKVTVSAEDDIVVTADVRVADAGAGTDVIGLVADNYVWVYHPVLANGANLLPSAQAVRNIDAAIVSLRHSFVVQNWAVGASLSTSSDQASKLRVFGAIAQQFRGPVGTASGTTGYLKNYIYDDRLQVLQPPYFIAPENAPWEAVLTTDG